MDVKSNSMTKTAPDRPVCRYYGGKWKLADWIIQFFPEHRCYVESFGGAASVLMKKKPARIEVYNDLADEMVNLFQVLRDPDQSAALRRQLDLTPYSRTEWLNCYDRSEDPVEQARRTIVLASMSHNPSKVMMRQSNGFRTSTSGYHRLPQDFQNLTANLEKVTSRLKDVIIENRDAQKLMKQHDRPTTLHFIDPPYKGDLRADSRNVYVAECFSDDEHVKLSETILKLKGYVVLCGYPSEMYRDIYESKGWKTFSTQAVTGAATPGKSLRTEVLWLNPKCAAAQLQQSLF